MSVEQTLFLVRHFLLHHGVRHTKVEMIFEEYNHREYMEFLEELLEIEGAVEEIEETLGELRDYE